MPLDPQSLAGALAKGPDMRNVMIIRHGATHLNGEGDTSVDRIRGWKNVPLNDKGLEEAGKLADTLAQKPPDVLLSSDLERAHETANIISQKTGVPVSETTQGFRPWNVGKFAGQKTTEAVPHLADYATNKPDEKTPDGESFNDFKDRFFSTLNDAMKRYQGNIGIVTHHRNERLMKAWQAAGFPPNGDIDKEEFSKKGEPTATATEMQVPHNSVQQIDPKSLAMALSKQDG